MMVYKVDLHKWEGGMEHIGVFDCVEKVIDIIHNEYPTFKPDPYDKALYFDDEKNGFIRVKEMKVQ